MAKRLQEKATLTKTGSKVRVRLINEGQGSSGFYAAEMLQEHGPKAFPKGTFLFWNHVPPDKRDIRDAFGVLAEDAVYEEDSKALWGDANIFEADRVRVMELAEAGAGMSIEAAGEVDSEGRVTEIAADPLNAVALVHRAGRGGAITTVLESATISDSDSNHQGEDAGMKPEEIEALATALAEKLGTALSQAITEALNPAPKETEGEAGPDALAVAEALADVPKFARSRIVEAIKAGAKIEDAVKAENDYIKEIEKAQTENEGRLNESGKSDTIEREPIEIKGW